ncbi:hypothetical protein ACA910_018350 [Epithemia clementina (nom. ined.)]
MGAPTKQNIPAFEAGLIDCISTVDSEKQQADEAIRLDVEGHYHLPDAPDGFVVNTRTKAEREKSIMLHGFRILGISNSILTGKSDAWLENRFEEAYGVSAELAFQVWEVILPCNEKRDYKAFLMTVLSLYLPDGMACPSYLKMKFGFSTKLETSFWLKFYAEKICVKNVTPQLISRELMSLEICALAFLRGNE